MTKVRTKKDLGLKDKEALALLRDSLKKEGFDEEAVRDFSELVVNGIKGKVTIHEKDIFEEKLKEIIKEYGEKLEKKDYRILYEQLLGLFQDKTKSRMIRFWDFWSYEANIFILWIIVIFVLTIIYILVK